MNIEAELKAVIQRFPELPTSSSDISNYYKCVRNVSIGNRVELQLRSTPDSAVNSNSIVLIINASKDIYAVPLLSNEHGWYWNFLFDTRLKSEKPRGTTFQSELQTAMDTLGLNDTFGTAAKVIEEMLISLLQCRRIYDSDSAEIYSTRLYANTDLLEVSDTCLSRINRSWKAIVTEMHPNEYVTVRNSYWDENNRRIYQLKRNQNRREKNEVGVRSYRQDCIFNFMDL